MVEFRPLKEIKIFILNPTFPSSLFSIDYKTLQAVLLPPILFL